MAKYDQGKYSVRNPKKYRGDPTNVCFRSSWEKRVLLWLDSHPACIEWSSEEVIIPYYSPVDEKMHRYFVDFMATFKYPDNSVRKFLIEVKPKSQTHPPIRGNKREKTFLTEAMTWTVNDAKWKAAKIYAEERDMKFIIVTEDDLGIAKR
jgi:hypothetical protein